LQSLQYLLTLLKKKFFLMMVFILLNLIKFIASSYFSFASFAVVQSSPRSSQAAPQSLGVPLPTRSALAQQRSDSTELTPARHPSLAQSRAGSTDTGQAAQGWAR
jgi:hypothetical protein